MFTGKTTYHKNMKIITNVKVEEARRPAHDHSLTAFHSFMETHNKSYNNR